MFITQSIVCELSFVNMSGHCKCIVAYNSYTIFHDIYGLFFKGVLVVLFIFNVIHCNIDVVCSLVIKHVVTFNIKATCATLPVRTHILTNT